MIKNIRTFHLTIILTILSLFIILSSTNVAKAEIVTFGGTEKIDSALKKGKPVLAYFYTTWCGSCKKSLPVIKKVQSDLQGRITFIYVDCDRYKTLASKYNIRSYPTGFFITSKDNKVNLKGYLHDKIHLKVKLKKLLKENN